MKREYIWPLMARMKDQIWSTCPRCKKTEKYSVPVETGKINAKCKHCERPITILTSVHIEKQEDLIDLKEKGIIC
jgi:hypothetical protein